MVDFLEMCNSRLYSNNVMLVKWPMVNSNYRKENPNCVDLGQNNICIHFEGENILEKHIY